MVFDLFRRGGEEEEAGGEEGEKKWFCLRFDVFIRCPLVPKNLVLPSTRTWPSFKIRHVFLRERVLFPPIMIILLGANESLI